MPLITVIFFFVFIGLLFLLRVVSLKTESKLGQALAYGKENFEIDLPVEASIDKQKSGSDFPHFAQCSDAEGFLSTCYPLYWKPVTKEKRGAL